MGVPHVMRARMLNPDKPKRRGLASSRAEREYTRESETSLSTACWCGLVSGRPYTHPSAALIIVVIAGYESSFHPICPPGLCSALR